MKKNNKTKGFTLIELLVVISIIGLLASVVVGAMQDAKTKAEDTARTRIVEEYKKAIILSYDKYGEYPNPGNTTNYYCFGDTNDADNRCGISINGIDYNNQNPTVNARITEFLNTLPPLNPIAIGANVLLEGILYKCTNLAANGKCEEARMEWVRKDMSRCPAGVLGESVILGGSLQICYYIFD